MVRLASLAKEQLPNEEQMMFARLLASERVAFVRTRDFTRHRWSVMNKAMSIDPSVFRRLSLALPVKFAFSQSSDGLVQASFHRS